MVAPPSVRAPSLGVRVLSVDGDGAGALSELLILEQIMYRTKMEGLLEEMPSPCDYFEHSPSHLVALDSPNCGIAGSTDWGRRNLCDFVLRACAMCLLRGSTASCRFAISRRLFWASHPGKTSRSRGSHLFIQRSRCPHRPSGR
ncbi:hypothetical protein FB451DRAFT_454521 [Mycena latifolia]|nr:hypothetical protein FB451DRAFT_454521 [Mycena latifolia]